MSKIPPLPVGVISALVTPFKADGSVNLDALQALAELQISQGVHGFYVSGTTGEAVLQSVEERKLVLSTFARAVDGRSRLIAHVGAVSTADTIALAHAAADAGYNAVSAIAPFYYEFSREELLAHYRTLAEATPLPLIVYNFPAKTPRPLSFSDLILLLDHPKIVGVKHTSQNLYQLERLKQARPEAVVFNGFDEMFVGGVAMGADGAIGTTYNFMGDLFVAAWTSMQRQDLATASKLQTRANHVIDMLIEVSVIPATKAILKHMGVDCGTCRAPFRPLNAEEEKRAIACYEQHLAGQQYGA